MNVRLKSGEMTNGYYLAADAANVYLIPTVGPQGEPRAIHLITVVPRDDVVALRLFHANDPVRSIETELPRALFGPFASLPVNPADQVLRRALLGYEAQLMSGPGWRFPPILSPRAVRYLYEHYGEFDPRTLHELPANAERVPMHALFTNPQLYTGQSIIARGAIVLSAQSPEGQGEGTEQRVFVTRSRSSPGLLGYCALTVPSTFSAHSGSTVELYATVLAWGSWDLTGGEPVHMTALACAAARAVPSRRPD
jgi:hypothetical protein